MTEPKPQDTQQDLFGWSTTGEPRRSPERPASATRAYKPILLTTSLEQILLTAIVAILAACLFFFLGVLRGKSLSEGAPAGSPARPAATAAAPARPASAPDPARVAAPVRALPAAEPQARPAGPLPGKAYTIQLVTYKKKEWAEKEAAPFRAAGMYTAIVPSNGYFIVCVGQYANKDEAKKDLKKLSGRFKDCYLRRHP